MSGSGLDKATADAGNTVTASAPIPELAQIPTPAPSASPTASPRASQTASHAVLAPTTALEVADADIAQRESNLATSIVLDRLRKLKAEAEAGSITDVEPRAEDDAIAILEKTARSFLESDLNKAAGPEPVQDRAQQNKRDSTDDTAGENVKRQRSEAASNGPETTGDDGVDKKTAARADRLGENSRDSAKRPSPRNGTNQPMLPAAGNRPPDGTRRPPPVGARGRPPVDNRQPMRKTNPRASGPPLRDDRRLPPARRASPSPGLNRALPRDADMPAARRDDHGPPTSASYRRDGPPDDRYRSDGPRPPYGGPPDDRHAYHSQPPHPVPSYGHPASPARSDGPSGPTRRQPPPQAYPDPRNYPPPSSYGTPPTRRYESPQPSSALTARIGPAADPRYSPGSYMDARPPPPVGYSGYRDDRPPPRVEERQARAPPPGAWDRDPYSVAYPPPSAYADRGPSPPYSDHYVPPAVAAPLASELDYLKMRMAELERIAAAATPPPPPPPRDYRDSRERISVGRNTRFNPDGPPAIVRTYDPDRRDDDGYYARQPPPPARRLQEARR